MMQLREFKSSEQLNQAFCQQIVAHLTEAIQQRGQAVLAVSGGRTPQALFSQLAATPLPWDKVTITLADDRFLPPEHPDSNEGLVKAFLLQQYAAAASFVSLYSPATDGDLDADAAIPRLLQRVKSLPDFDVLILGMGEDGHTASLFPCSQQLSYAMADAAPDVVAVHPTTAPYARISFSRPKLQRSKHIYLHVVGAKKQAVLQQAVAGHDIFAMPIRAFIHANTPELQVMYSEQ